MRPLHIETPTWYVTTCNVFDANNHYIASFINIDIATIFVNAYNNAEF